MLISMLKEKRIKAGSKEKMRKVGSKGAPTEKNFKKAKKTTKKEKESIMDFGLKKKIKTIQPDKSDFSTQKKKTRYFGTLQISKNQKK
jgi:hypothetical protein